MTKLACFGAGRIGQIHAVNAAAHADVELVYLVDPVTGADRDLLAARTGAEIAGSDEVFTDDSVDGIIIASSTDSHAGLLLRAAETGKAVFCEKPISLDFTLTTQSGRQAQITACRRGPMGYDQRLEALCAREVLTVGNQPQSTLGISDPQGCCAGPPENYFFERFAQAYRDEMDACVALLRDGSQPFAGIEDGLEAQRLVEAAAQSARTGEAIAFGPGWAPDQGD